MNQINDLIGAFSATDQYTAFNNIELLLAMAFGIVIAFTLVFIFDRFTLSISNRSGLGNTAVLLMVCIISIIFVIKSSLALSLGLVGALSIVRFRTVIKEPEQLAFLFSIIACGIALGAGKFFVAIIVVLAIAAVMNIRSFMYGSSITNNATQSLIIKFKQDETTLTEIEAIFSANNISARIRRFETGNGTTELFVDVSDTKGSKLQNLISSLNEKSEYVSYVGA